MIEAFKGLYHKYDLQIIEYNKIRANLTIEDKHAFINSFEGREFWGYFQLIADVMYEVAEDSDRFVNLLGIISEKVKNDMAQRPFLDLLCRIGEQKKFALSLYNNILDSGVKESMKIVAGLILGKYALKHQALVEIELRLGQPILFPYSNSYLKAALVYYENDVISNKVFKYLDKVCKQDNVFILQEAANFCLANYKKDPSKFYAYLEAIVKKNKFASTWAVFDRMRYTDVLDKNETLKLVEIAKDYDNKVIDLLVEILQKYPDESKLLARYFIQWMNRGADQGSQSFDYVVADLAQKNKSLIYELFSLRKELDKYGEDGYILLFPHMFREISKHHLEDCLKLVISITDAEKNLFLDLASILLGNIFNNLTHKALIIDLTQEIVKRARARSFITFDDSAFQSRIKKKSISMNDLNYVVDFAKDLIDKMKTRQTSYQFDIIEKNLKKYPQLHKLCADVVVDLKVKKAYSPLLWLGQTEEPILDKVDISDTDTELQRALKQSYIRSKFWSRAYLKELESAVVKYLLVNNSKFKDKFSKLKTSLAQEESFWSFESELVFMNKFKAEHIVTVEPSVPNKPAGQLDLQVNISGRNLYFEIKRPEIDRLLGLSNTAVGLDNKSLTIIYKKFRQLFAEQTLIELQSGKRSDAFFIVIDASSSTVDEYHILNALLGSLAFTFVVDTKTGKEVDHYNTRMKDSIHDGEKKTDVICGVIFYKQELYFDSKYEPYLKLTGDVVKNPNAIVKLSDVEFAELKSTLFG